MLAVDGVTVRFGGADLLSVRAHRVVRLGIAGTFQNLALVPTMSALDNTIVGTYSRAREPGRIYGVLAASSAA